MNGKNRFLSLASIGVGVACGVCCAALGWFAHGFWGPGPKSVVRAVARVPAVAVEAVRAEKINPAEEFVAHVEPVQEVDILPQIEGYLEKVCFAEGDEVKAGDLLFVIDDERYAADQGVARAELEQARSKVVQAEATVDRSTRYLRRLSSADARGVTRTEMDAAETGLAADRAALASAKAAVSQAEAALASTAFNLKHTKIFAPIAGRIGKSLRHAGDFVSPSKGVLARIVQMDPVRVSFPITDRAYLAWGRTAAERGAKVGDTRRLRLRLADGSIYPASGTWEFSDNEMSSETATLIVRALFPNATRTLVPKAYVTVLADEANPAAVPTVPATALVTRARATGVWMLASTNTVSFREVGTGGRAEGRVQIVRGVAPGEKIVTQGVHKLGEGMAVKVVPPSVFQ